VPTRDARSRRHRCIRALLPTLVAALAISTLGAFGPAPAVAEDDPGTASVTGVDRLEEVRRELAGSSEEMVRAVALMREADEALPAARAAATKARAEFADVTRRRAEAAGVRGQAQTRLVQTEREAEEAAAAARDGENQLGRLAREAYQLGPENGLLAMVAARSPHDVNARLMQLSTLAEAQSAAIRRWTSPARATTPGSPTSRPPAMRSTPPTRGSRWSRRARPTSRPRRRRPSRRTPRSSRSASRHSVRLRPRWPRTPAATQPWPPPPSA
jgi:hypothetical protein